MTRKWLLAMSTVAALAAAGCGEDSPTTPVEQAQITVYTHDGGVPATGIQAEVLNTTLSGSTGQDGKLNFTVLPGDYTVRVHRATATPPPYFDHHVNVRNGDAVTIDADLCWSCAFPVAWW
jgi:hypothetical protein